MTGTYAAGTDVPVSRSRDEIERTIQRFGASSFAYFSSSDGEVAIGFEMNGLRVLMRMQLPKRDQFRLTDRGRDRSESTIDTEWEKACRQRWRSLANGVKAKLALIDDGISTFEREFLADIVVPTTGQTYGDFAIPQLQASYERNELPPMIPERLS